MSVDVAAKAKQLRGGIRVSRVTKGRSGCGHRESECLVSTGVCICSEVMRAAVSTALAFHTQWPSLASFRYWAPPYIVTHIWNWAIVTYPSLRWVILYIEDSRWIG